MVVNKRFWCAVFTTVCMLSVCQTGDIRSRISWVVDQPLQRRIRANGHSELAIGRQNGRDTRITRVENGHNIHVTNRASRYDIHRANTEHGLAMRTASIENGHTVRASLKAADPSQSYYDRLPRHARRGTNGHTYNQYTWGQWSEFSSCSQSCGIGIRKRKRKCYKITHWRESESSSWCSGVDHSHQLCNTQACLVGGNDVRIGACSAYNNKYYKGRYSTWKPINKESAEELGYSPCALVCQAQNYPFQMIVKFSNRVPDGTTCLTNKMNGTCINYRCIPIGCDQTLHSTRTYDVCGVCGGYNKTCDVIKGEINRTLHHGYTTVLTIPPHVLDIIIADQGGVLAVFALRSDHGIYFVNGKLSSSNPTVYSDVAGTTFLYYRPVYGRNRVERLESSGPTNETIYVMMLSREDSRDIYVTYQYSIPKPTKQRRTSVRHAIPQTLRQVSLHDHGKQMSRDLSDHTHSSHISRDMSDHTHHKFVSRRRDQISRDTSWRKQSIDDLSNSNTNKRYDGRATHQQSQTYNNSISEYLGTNSYTSADEHYPERLNHLSRDIDEQNLYNWVTNAAAHCSVTCNNGVVTAYTKCVRRVDRQAVDDIYCDARIKPSPVNVQCKGKTCHPRWEMGDWEGCSTACGDGQQTRSVRCWRLIQPGFDSSVRSDMCRKLPKPIGIRRCTETDCGPAWELSQWSECSSKCGRGIQKRAVHCSSKIQSCDLEAKPISFRQCSSETCFNKWVVSKWSTCSGACGVGLEYRRVSCLDPSSSYLGDEYCDQNRKPLSVQACGDRAQCPPVWVAQAWGGCSVDCGDGLKSRDVVCGDVIHGEFKSRNERKCSHLYKPATRSRCQQEACPAQWFTSEWSQCSKTCGTEGYQTRKVSCYSQKQHSTECDRLSKPANRETCNIFPCDKTTTASTKQVPEVTTHKEVCVDKDGINCRDVVLRQGCGITRYRNLCCQSCKTLRISSNNTTYRNRAQRSVTPDHGAGTRPREKYSDLDNEYVTSYTHVKTDNVP